MKTPLKVCLGVPGNRKNALGCGDGSGRMVFAELSDTLHHVADGLDGAEGLVRDLDGKCLFDLEGDVDLVEGVDVEFVEGAGEGDRVRGNALRFCDDLNAALRDVVIVLPGFLLLLAQLTGMPMPV